MRAIVMFGELVSLIGMIATEGIEFVGFAVLGVTLATLQVIWSCRA